MLFPVKLDHPFRWVGLVPPKWDSPNNGVTKDVRQGAARSIALANEQKRRDEELACKQMEAENAQRQLQQNASDEEQTEAIFQYCKSVFQGFKLKPTGHDVTVDKALPQGFMASRAMATITSA